MTTLTVFITTVLINFVLGKDDVCNYDCSYATLNKPCKNLNEKNIRCIDYNYYGVCPEGYKDCTEYSNPCNKECSLYTKNLPCISINKGDTTCYDYIQGKECPLNTKDCSDNIEDPCEYCNAKKPCLHGNKGDYSCLEINKYGGCNPGSTLCVYNDDKYIPKYKPKQPIYEGKCDICSKSQPCLSDKYIYGEYKCFEQKYKYGKLICPEGSSICELYNLNICNKECSYETRWKPCMNLNKDDNTCFDYLDYGGCPPGTKDCSNDVQNPCEYCDAKKPCLHDNYGDYSCLETNKYGNCSPGSTLCQHSSAYKRKTTKRSRNPRPTWKPTRRPTKKPTKKLTKKPTKKLTKRLTKRPTKKPSQNPTKGPTKPLKQKICGKKCSYETKNKPCMSVVYGNNSCYGYLYYSQCPPGTKDCSSKIQNKCKYCNPEKPCFHNNYDYSCFSTNKYGTCNPGSTLCIYENDKCSQSCKPYTYGPCMSKKKNDNTCYKYNYDGSCPYETIDCGYEEQYSVLKDIDVELQKNMNE